MGKIKKYIFKRNSKYPINTYLEGGGLQMTTKAIFSFITGVAETEIENYNVIGSNIYCHIKSNYVLGGDTFSPVSDGNSGNWYPTFGDTRTIIKYKDLGGKCTGIIDQVFVFQSNFQEAYFPYNGFTIRDSQNFRQTDLRIGYFPNMDESYIGTSASVNLANFGVINESLCNITAPIFYATNNAGSPDADLQQYITDGGSVTYV